MNPKQRAAEAALAYVKSGMTVGLGTGSTADFFLQALAHALETGTLRDIRGIPTSRQSEHRARQLGIPLIHLDGGPGPDITVDGTDEVDPNLDLIKGLGGALLREKIVAQNSKQLVIIADATKVVSTLGTRSPLPVEVAPFAFDAHEPFFRQLGATPVLRRLPNGNTFVTDNGNFVYDCRFERIGEPAKLEDILLHRAGIVDCGLFLGMARIALIASSHGVETRQR